MLKKIKVGSFSELKHLKDFRFEYQHTDFKIKTGTYGDYFLQSVENNIIETVGVIELHRIDNQGFTFIFKHFGILCEKRIEFSDIFYIQNL